MVRIRRACGIMLLAVASVGAFLPQSGSLKQGRRPLTLVPGVFKTAQKPQTFATTNEGASVACALIMAAGAGVPKEKASSCAPSGFMIKHAGQKPSSCRRRFGAGIVKLWNARLILFFVLPLFVASFPNSAAAAAVAQWHAKKIENQALAASTFFFNLLTPAALIAAGALQDAFIFVNAQKERFDEDRLSTAKWQRLTNAYCFLMVIAFGLQLMTVFMVQALLLCLCCAPLSPSLVTTTSATGLAAIS